MMKEYRQVILANTGASDDLLWLCSNFGVVGLNIEGDKGEPIMRSPFALHLLRRPVHPGWFSALFKDQFVHELRAHDISNFRPIYIPLHTLLVIYPSSLTKHFVCFLLILLK